MATVREAVRRLENERGLVAKAKVEVLEAAQASKDKAVRGHLMRVVQRQCDILESIDYVLNVLESGEEAVCPD